MESKYKSIEELSQKRNIWLGESKEQDMFEGIKNTLTKLYTSSGHFIFELLQNAEDVFATSVTFKLESDKLIFEHNGSRKFDLNDIDSITNIGNSKKKDEGNPIGKFGIGFKSVFEYTASPEIHSGDYHFKIEDLVVPKVIPAPINIDKEKTVMVLPFNGERHAQKCYDEINFSLTALEGEVLLFLRNIKEVNCIIGTKALTLKRIDSYAENNCPNNVCQILKKNKDGNAIVIKKGASIYNPPKRQLFYKRFFKSIKVLDEESKEKKITIAVAFKIEYTEKNKKWKIKPIFKDDGEETPGGRIFAYFPCEAEQSRFCFHIHAPFALTVDREKLRDEDANRSVIEEIGSLLCESMEELKSDGLVDLDLYKTLPNDKDDKSLGQFEDIKSKIIDFFLNNPYVLMSDGSYHDGKNKYIGFNNIQKLLTNKDLSTLYDSNQTAYWVKNPMQNKRDYNFLTSLQVKEYDITDFLSQLLELQEKSNDKYSVIVKSLENRDVTWFVRLYSLMTRCWDKIDEYAIPDLQLCYCTDRKLYAFRECYLSSSVSGVSSQNVHFVNSECLDGKQTKSDLDYFFRYKLELEEYKISDMIQSLCKEFEQKQDKSLNDTIEFYKMYQKDNSIADVLRNHEILCSDKGEWDKPEWFYLPEEFGGSVKNLSIYYDYYNLKTDYKEHIYKLNTDYKDCFESNEELQNFISFLKELGIKTSLTVRESSCKTNPIWWWQIYKHAEKVSGGNAFETDEDFEVKYLANFLKRPQNEAVFELILTFLQNARLEWKTCRYSPAQKYTPKVYLSHIAVDLCDNAWVLQVHDEKEYFVKPADAFISRLPTKYKKQIENPNIQGWFFAIGFGKKERQQSEEQKKENEILASYGFDSELADIIRELKDRGANLKDYMQTIKEVLQSKIADGFSSKDDVDEERIKDKTAAKYYSADDIEFEKRYRSVRVGSDQKSLAVPFLRSNCIDEDGRLHCQICRKTMPFKDKNGEDYFEVVELFHKELIKKDVKESYVALCPVCSAKMAVYYQHNKDRKKKLYDSIRRSQDRISCFKIDLDKEEEIMFAKKHIIALRQIIEEAYNESSEA